MHADTCGADWTRLSPCPVFSSRCLHARVIASSRRPVAAAAYAPMPTASPVVSVQEIELRRVPQAVHVPARAGGLWRLVACRAMEKGIVHAAAASESRALHCAVCWVEMAGGSGRGVRDNFAPEDEGLIHKREVGPMVMGELRTAAARRTPPVGGRKWPV
jgi:hypothetical protein